MDNKRMTKLSIIETQMTEMTKGKTQRMSFAFWHKFFLMLRRVQKSQRANCRF